MVAGKRMMIIIMTYFVLGILRTLRFERRAQILCTFSFLLTRSQGTNRKKLYIREYSLIGLLRGGA